jgi:hypothetical protein
LINAPWPAVQSERRTHRLEEVAATHGDSLADRPLDLDFLFIAASTAAQIGCGLGGRGGRLRRRRYG